MSTRAARGDHPDTVYVNGRILTMDGPEPSYVEAVVTRNGRIAFAGDRAEAHQRFAGAQVCDLHGRALLPGFVDAHSHLVAGFDLVDQVNVAAPPVGSVRTIADVLDALERFRDDRHVPASGWIIGWGYDPEDLAERRHITAADLDERMGNHRVVLMLASKHGAVLSSAALAAVGVDASTPTPPGGVIARVGATDQPAGLLMETAFLHHVAANLPRPSVEERLELLDDVQQLYASNGYTHAQDGFTVVEDLDLLVRAASEGRLYLDVVALGSFMEADAWLGNAAYPTGDYRDGFRVAGMKIIHDGSPQGRTAYVTEPYLTGGPSGQSDWIGEPTSSYEVLEATVRRALDAGVQVFTHTNGDAAMDDLIRAVRSSGHLAGDDRRPVAIHSQLQRRDQLDEYVELGILPSYFTNHVFFWGDVHAANLGAERAAFISPMRSAMAKGLVVSNHTDFSVTPLDPLLVIWSSMARTTRTGATLGEDERLDGYAALQAVTTGAAHQVFEERRKGRIAEGLLADLVVLSADPLAVPFEDLRAIEVLETIKEGVTVFGGMVGQSN